MSTAFTHQNPRLSLQFTESTAEQVKRVVEAVQHKIAPVWPLRDFVAVNPFGGLTHQKFLDARARLQAVSDCEMLMPVAYYRQRFNDGHFGIAELGQAVDEMVADRIPGAESLNANAIYKSLESQPTNGESRNSGRRVQLASQCYDQFAGTNWGETISLEIGKHCSAHYDEGQASWPSPYQDLPLYQAWRAASQVDRNVEILGLAKFRSFVSELPSSPTAAIFFLLSRVNMTQPHWEDYLLCVAMSLPGWSAWAKYKTEASRKKGFESQDFASLLAIRLAYDVALSEQFGIAIDHAVMAEDRSKNQEYPSEALVGMTLMRANEIGFRDSILNSIHLGSGPSRHPSSANQQVEDRKLAQMVFCIDVRSERIRRNLERTSNQIETFGFAGFFGLPIEYVRMGDARGTNQLPVLLDPKFKVYEEVRPSVELAHSNATATRRTRIRQWRHLWKTFQTSTVSCFAYVETNGLFYLKYFIDRLRGYAGVPPHRDGIREADVDRTGPGFRGLNQQGIGDLEQIDIAESILRGIGVTEDFANLVVFCGHGSSTVNNPLQAGLDCGACAGHSGEANARFAAMLLNRPAIRAGLAERGIRIPQSTHFLAGLHDTTTDDIRFFDFDLAPDTSAGFISELQANACIASTLTRNERLQVLPGDDEQSLIQRSLDWSEVRPEWGLSGNAALIIGPRELTKSFSLRGESFLHSYNYRRDSNGRLLEQIMTAPLIVANWINLQYFASTVDQDHFGSGAKTIHNVVGKFGVLSGNGGDLTTGLAWESIHNGKTYQHDPKRLLAVMEAPRAWVERILASHQNVSELAVNGWIHLIVIDNARFYRFTENSEWQQLQVGLPHEAVGVA